MTLEQRIEALERRVAELEEKQFDQTEYEAKLDVLAWRCFHPFTGEPCEFVSINENGFTLQPIPRGTVTLSPVFGVVDEVLITGCYSQKP